MVKERSHEGKVFLECASLQTARHYTGRICITVRRLRRPPWGEARAAVPRRYVRLHLLEGVAAFHAGDAPAARARLLVRPPPGACQAAGVCLSAFGPVSVRF